MKSLLRLTLLTVALTLTCGAATYAQKFGYINTQEVVFGLPEIEEVNTKLEALNVDLEETFEEMQVEFNKKVEDYTQGMEKMSDSVKKIKEQEMQSLRLRIEEFQGVAERSINEEYSKLMQPLFEKTGDAIEKISKANGYTIVFEIGTQAMAYFDKNSVTDITGLVKKELGIE